MLLIAIAIVLATFLVETAFVYLATAKRLLELGLLPRDFRLVAYVWVVIGYPADVAFNLLRGSIEFRELPPIVWRRVLRLKLPIPELLFTSRVQRHCDGSSGWRLERAQRWATVLNAVDPGHVKR